jgi:adenosylmethionine-8-amino-7-oxononanoate aminotransferase
MKPSGVFVTGVDTGIGKTTVSAGLAAVLRSQGVRVGVMKPVQSGGGTKRGRPVSKDLEFLNKAARRSDPTEWMNPYCFSAPLSPYHASLREGREIDPARIVSAFRELRKRHSFMIVEGAGGLKVPIAESYFMEDLIADLDLPLLVVTHPYLGMINHTLLTVAEARIRGLDVVGILINQYSRKRFDPPDVSLIERESGAPVLGILPYLPGLSVEKGRMGRLAAVFKKRVQWKRLFNSTKKNQKIRERETWAEKDKKFIWHPFTQMKDWLDYPSMPVIDSAFGVRLRDVDGTEYLDGHSSYWANTHGHNNPELNRAAIRQLNKVAHSTLFGLSNTSPIALAEKLVAITPPDLTRVFYSDDGSTAVEVALKMAFQYWRNLGNPKKKKFVCLGNAYHGDTLGSVGVGRVDLYHRLFEALLFDSLDAPSPYCYRCPLGKEFPDCGIACVEELNRVVRANADEIAALILEPLVQCPGGIITAPHGYLKRARKICEENGILFIADEVAVGFGRTGKMFACDHEEVVPDILALSKSLAGGYMPLGVTMTTEKIFEAFLGEVEEGKTFYHGHTFTGHPLACAVALRNIELFEETGLLASVVKKSHLTADQLIRFRNLGHVGDIRQRGLIVGIELVQDRQKKNSYPPRERIGRRVAEEARRRRLIVRPLGDVMVFFPALAVGEEDLSDMLDILYDSIASVTEPG